MAEAQTYEQLDFSGQYIEWEEMCGQRFIECDFQNADFSDVSRMQSCVFERCSFASAKMNGLRPKNTAFLGCNFRYTGLWAAVFEDCKMTGSDFSAADCSRLSIRRGDWSYTNLRGAKFKKEDLSQVVFRNADLTGARFEACDLRGCDFTEAWFQNTVFSGSQMQRAVLNNVALRGADFTGAKLDLEQCVLLTEALTGGRFEPELQ